MLLLYTDGLLDSAEEPSGAEPVERILRQCKGLAARAIVDRLAEHVRTRGPQSDDVTFVIIKRVSGGAVLP